MKQQTSGQGRKVENGPAKSSQNWLRNAFVEQINAQESAGLLRTVNKQAWAGEGDAEDAPPRKGFHLLALCFALLIIFFCPAFNCFNLFYACFDAEHYLLLMKEFHSAIK